MPHAPKANSQRRVFMGFFPKILTIAAILQPSAGIFSSWATAGTGFGEQIIV
jgi:hypothetical protein